MLPNFRSPHLGLVESFSGRKIDLGSAIRALNQIPGSPNFLSLASAKQPPDTLVVQGTDQDLLVTTNQWFVVNEADALDQGISLLKKMLSLDKIVLAVPSLLLTLRLDDRERRGRAGKGQFR